MCPENNVALSELNSKSRNLISALEKVHYETDVERCNLKEKCLFFLRINIKDRERVKQDCINKLFAHFSALLSLPADRTSLFLLFDNSLQFFIQRD